MSGWNVTGIRPGEIDSHIAHRAMTRISQHLEGNPGAEPIELLGLAGITETVLVPRAVAELLSQMLGWLADGHGIQVVLESAMLTTQQAAEMMNVSRLYLTSLLDSDAMPYQMVGSSRRVALTDLLDYKRADEQSRRRVRKQLAGLMLEYGED